MTAAQNKTPVRDRILQTACDLFYNQGYRATGINQVIKESGVAKASFYDHFPSKEALLNAYVKTVAERDLMELREEVLKMPAGRERFLGPFSVLDPWLKETDFRGCPFQNIASELPADDTVARGTLREHREHIRMFLRELTEAYVAEDAALSHVDCDAFSHTYLVIFEGVLATTAAYGALWPVETGVQAVEALLNAQRR
jgi:AcrR family transcriptional regulator